MTTKKRDSNPNALGVDTDVFHVFKMYGQRKKTQEFFRMLWKDSIYQGLSSSYAAEIC